MTTATATAACRRCAVDIEYEPIPGFPGIRPGLCDACSESYQRERRVAQMQERLRYGRVPHALWSFDVNLGNTDLLAWCWQHRHQSIWLAGATGLGKTRCLCRTAVRLAWDDHTAIIAYRAAFDWLREVGSMMGRDVGEAEAEIHRAKVAAVLILDDLGQEKLTERGAEVVFSVLDFRLRENRRCWVTTNASAGGLDEKLGRDRGRALRRRLAEACAVYGGAS